MASAPQLDIDTIASALKAGWSPPPLDYEAWRPALVAYYTGKGLHFTAQCSRDGELDAEDHRTIQALALALPHAPASNDG
jgi:hypothetical protein